MKPSGKIMVHLICLFLPLSLSLAVFTHAAGKRFGVGEGAGGRDSLDDYVLY